MATSEEKALKLSQHFDALEDLMEDGPSASDAEFLRNLQAESRLLTSALEALTVEDISEIWQEAAEDEEEEI